MLIQKLVRIILSIFCLVVTNGCGRGLIKVQDPNHTAKNNSSSKLSWLQFRPERINAVAIGGLRQEFAFDQEKSKLAAGFGIENAQILDLGVYGKMGTKTVFVAPAKSIPDYDRLYWAMVRVLSEKYGCFIKTKSSNANTVTVGCKDTRSIVIDREIANGYAKFSGRQFDRIGREIIVTPRVVATKKSF